jgi:hypothetical protein
LVFKVQLRQTTYVVLYKNLQGSNPPDKIFNIQLYSQYRAIFSRSQGKNPKKNRLAASPSHRDFPALRVKLLVQIYIPKQKPSAREGKAENACSGIQFPQLWLQN